MKLLRFLATTRRAQRDERGGALVLVLIIGVLLTGAGAMIVTRTSTEGKLADEQTEYEGALHAAEAGANDYIAKLTEDRIYFRHRVHPAEDARTRVSPLTGTYAPDTVWPGDPTWTYPATKQRFAALKGSSASNYEYNLRIDAPSGGPVTITATGRRRNSPRVSRSLEIVVKGSSIADYQAIIDADVTYGATAVTTGKIYSTHNIDYLGTASADVIAEGNITNSSNTAVIVPPARRCDVGGTYGCRPREAVTSAISFGSFAAAFAEIKRVAQSTSLGGIYLNDTTKSGWRLTFINDATVKVEACTTASHIAAGATPPTTCTLVGTRSVPALGVIYAEQTVVVQGTVKGRVTVAGNQDIVIGGNISYNDTSVDVLGLLAQNSVFVAEYAPDSLTWKGAVLAENGAVRYYGPGVCDGRSHGTSSTMTFIGSMATKNTPCMATYSGSTLVGGYAARTYNYDPNLSNLQPPFIPVLEDAYVIQRYREVNP